MTEFQNSCFEFIEVQAMPALKKNCGMRRATIPHYPSLESFP